MRINLLGLFLRAGLGLLGVGVAHAHFALLQPPSALANEDGGKGAPPCAEGNDSKVVTDAQGGHAINIRLSEFVFHPGHYRFALSVNSRAELPPDPEVAADGNGNSVSAAIQSPVKAPVLADGVFLHTAPPSGDWVTTLTLPNLNCDQCTLQIIEFMAEHGANIGGGFFYHHCADLRIKADPNLPPADASWPRAAVLTNAAVPHFAAGGGSTTTLTLVNTTSAPVPATITFRGNDGAALTMQFDTTLQRVATTTVASSVNAIVNPNATLVISTGDAFGPTVKGWADVRSSGALGGFAGIRSSPGVGPVVEGVIPLQFPVQPVITLPFDNTGGSLTEVAIANVSADAATIGVTIWDDTGAVVATQSIALAAGGRMELSLADQAPVTAGIRGLIRLQGAASGSIAASALRLNALGGFTSLLPIL